MQRICVTDCIAGDISWIETGCLHMQDICFVPVDKTAEAQAG